MTESNSKPSDQLPGDSLDGIVRELSTMREIYQQSLSVNLKMLAIMERERPDIRQGEEIERLRASLGAIHYHAKRAMDKDADKYCILASIKAEAEHRIPELRHTLPNVASDLSSERSGED